MATHKKLMTVLSKTGNLEKRHDIIFSFTNGRTQSSKELTPEESETLIKVLQSDAIKKLDKKRKRVIAAIFGVYKMMNTPKSIEFVKGVACRAAGTKSFNEISSHQLDTIYAAFKNQQKALTFSGRIVENYIEESKYYN